MFSVTETASYFSDTVPSPDSVLESYESILPGITAKVLAAVKASDGVPVPQDIQLDALSELSIRILVYDPTCDDSFATAYCPRCAADFRKLRAETDCAASPPEEVAFRVPLLPWNSPDGGFACRVVLDVDRIIVAFTRRLHCARSQRKWALHPGKLPSPHEFRGHSEHLRGLLCGPRSILWNGTVFVAEQLLITAALGAQILNLAADGVSPHALAKVLWDQRVARLYGVLLGIAASSLALRQPASLGADYVENGSAASAAGPGAASLSAVDGAPRECDPSPAAVASPTTPTPWSVVDVHRQLSPTTPTPWSVVDVHRQLSPTTPTPWSVVDVHRQLLHRPGSPPLLDVVITPKMVRCIIVNLTPALLMQKISQQIGGTIVRILGHGAECVPFRSKQQNLLAKAQTLGNEYGFILGWSMWVRDSNEVYAHLAALAHDVAGRRNVSPALVGIRGDATDGIDCALAVQALSSPLLPLSLGLCKAIPCSKAPPKNSRRIELSAVATSGSISAIPGSTLLSLLQPKEVDQIQKDALDCQLLDLLALQVGTYTMADTAQHWYVDSRFSAEALDHTFASFILQPHRYDILLATAVGFLQRWRWNNKRMEIIKSYLPRASPQFLTNFNFYVPPSVQPLLAMSPGDLAVHFCCSAHLTSVESPTALLLSSWGFMERGIMVSTSKSSRLFFGISDKFTRFVTTEDMELAEFSDVSDVDETRSSRPPIRTAIPPLDEHVSCGAAVKYKSIGDVPEDMIVAECAFSPQDASSVFMSGILIRSCHHVLDDNANHHPRLLCAPCADSRLCFALAPYYATKSVYVPDAMLDEQGFPCDDAALSSLRAASFAVRLLVAKALCSPFLHDGILDYLQSSYLRQYIVAVNDESDLCGLASKFAIPLASPDDWSVLHRGVINSERLRRTSGERSGAMSAIDAIVQVAEGPATSADCTSAATTSTERPFALYDVHYFLELLPFVLGAPLLVHIAEPVMQNFVCEFQSGEWSGATVLISGHKIALHYKDLLPEVEVLAKRTPILIGADRDPYQEGVIWYPVVPIDGARLWLKPLEAVPQLPSTPMPLLVPPSNVPETVSVLPISPDVYGPFACSISYSRRKFRCGYEWSDFDVAILIFSAAVTAVNSSGTVQRARCPPSYYDGIVKVFNWWRTNFNATHDESFAIPDRDRMSIVHRAKHIPQLPLHSPKFLKACRSLLYTRIFDIAGYMFSPAMFKFAVCVFLERISYSNWTKFLQLLEASPLIEHISAANPQLLELVCTLIPADVVNLAGDFEKHAGSFFHAVDGEQALKKRAFE